MFQIRKQTHRVLADTRLQANLRGTLGKTLHSRQQAVAEVDNWEELRNYARQVKLHTLSRLGSYLEELETNVRSAGGEVIWARDGEEALQSILEVAAREQVRRVVKSKSMVGEEIHLNEHLERAGIEPVETDLGEYIIQLAGETPSHIVAPALHKSKEQVAELFVQRLGMAPTSDVEELTATARRMLRRKFLTADMGLTGVNFAVAETGTLVVVENEGNARLSVSVPRVHVALMGIEKVIPRTADLAVFLKLLARSATGQRMTSYVDFISGPRRGREADGPERLYLVLLDNGRSRILQEDFLRQTLACIRCGACLNVCPVFQRIGGHAYQSTYSGPIGAILTPQLLSLEEAPEHPFASSLCGACREICPVKIEIPEILLQLRARIQEQQGGKLSFLRPEQMGMRLWAWSMESARRYEWAGRWLRRLGRLFLKEGRLRLPVPPFSHWQKYRDLPELPEESFRQWFARRRKGA